MKKILQLPLAAFARCVGRIRVNQVSFVDIDGIRRVRKRRFWFGWALIFLGNIAFRFRYVPLRILHKAEWISWERKLKLTLRNEPIPASTELLCEKIQGRPLSDLMFDLSRQEIELPNKLAAVQFAVRALKGLHETSIQLADNPRSVMLSHGDAAISNVLYCVETQTAEWFDFDLRHDYRVAAVQRQADDLRSLLFTTGYLLPEEVLEPLVMLVKQEYPCEKVWMALQRQLASGWFWLDLFHLSQTRRLQARYQIDEINAARSDKILLELISKA